ncbi:MAG: FtsQ-type POTRA domain-containing protein [Verrucomicrobia bacterium]|nr:FtsQ-type POTRA domain-containing protein [Verrucomicrobiota bacterium]
MNPLPSNLTPARHWRDIPQAVSHRAMSTEGKRRAMLRTLKIVGTVVSVALLAWGGLEVAEALRDQPGVAPSVPSAPLSELVLVTDGVLDRAWVSRTLAVPRGTSLLSLDLFQLRTRLLASGQVRAATLTKNFPSTLAVNLNERTPVARLQVADGPDDTRTLLVARDGTVFEGVNYDPKLVETLPWLAGIRLTRQGGVFQPVANMATVADLLAKAKLEAEHLYADWRSVSLEFLAKDHEIKVATRGGQLITFSTNEDYFRQLANLDAILDAAKAHPERTLRAINLAIGSQVPAAFSPASPADGAPDSPVRPAPAVPRAPLFTGFNPH